MDGDQLGQAAADDQQHRPSRDHSDPLVAPAPDSEDDDAEDDAEDEPSAKADDNETAAEDQVVPKRQPQTAEKENDDAFQTPSVNQQQQPETVEEEAEDSFQTPSAPQVQLADNEDTERFETPSAPQGELQTGSTMEELFQTPSTGGEFSTSYVPQGQAPFKGNGSGFSTPGASLVVDNDPFSADASSSPSSSLSWLNNPKDYFAFGAFVTVAVITSVLLIVGRYQRWYVCGRRRRREPQGTPWANEIKFHDEYEDTDEDTDDPEDFYNNYMVDSHPKAPIDLLGGSKSIDWLGGMNFAVGEEGSHNDAKSAENFDDFSQSEQSQSSVSYDSDGNGLSEILNGDSSNSNRGQSLFVEPSPPVSPLVHFAPEPEISPPTVSEVFRNSMSPHWENGKKPAPRFEEYNTLEELEREQGDLNQALFLINDQLLEQQRELKVAAQALTQKTTRRKHREATQNHKSITEEIARLEAEKDDIDAKIMTVRTKLKAHRHDRRLKLFANHE